MKQNYLTTAWLVLLLAVLFGGGLAGVHTVLDPIIRANLIAETYQQVPKLVPSGIGTEGMTEVAGVNAYPVDDGDGRRVGWVIPAAGQGFADRIEVLLGLNADASEITGVYVLDQKETPGLGNRIVEQDWRDTFSGKSTSQRLSLTKADTAGDYDIQSITGATISSESIVDIVNRAVAEFREALREAGE